MEEILHALECGDNDVPQKFPDPFRYAPCPAVIMAAGKVISHIDSDRSLHDAMSEGKMLGVLVVRTDGGYGFLAAFSGNAGGRNSLPYFVPPIFDLLDPDGHFRKEESIISGISGLIHVQPQFTGGNIRLVNVFANTDQIDTFGNFVTKLFGIVCAECRRYRQY